MENCTWDHNSQKLAGITALWKVKPHFPFQMTGRWWLLLYLNEWNRSVLIYFFQNMSAWWMLCPENAKLNYWNFLNLFSWCSVPSWSLWCWWCCHYHLQLSIEPKMYLWVPLFFRRKQPGQKSCTAPAGRYCMFVTQNLDEVILRGSIPT